MTALLPALTLCLFLAPAAALVSSRLRLPAAVLLGLAAAGLGAALAQGAADEARLTVVHTFAAYVGADIVAKPFVVDEVTAAGWQWPALALLWAAGWAAWCASRFGRDPGSPVVGPMVLAWGGAALLLGLQKTAAPAALALGLQLPSLPPFEVAVFPAGLAAAVRLATSLRAVLPMLAHLTVFVALAHLPLAIFGTLATKRHWGTFLDVHRIDFIANPFTQVPQELEAGSTEQLAWLVWAPQLLILPGLTMMSAGGVGFAALMFAKHRAQQRGE